MMGSSGHQDNLLEALLVLVSDPNAVKARIGSLQKKIAEHDAAYTKAQEASLKVAKEEAIAKDQIDLAEKKKVVLSEQTRQIELDKTNLQDANGAFLSQKAKHQEDLITHEANVKGLSADQAALHAKSVAFDESMKIANAKLDHRVMLLDKREADLADRESAANSLHAKAQEKIERLKQVAAA